MAEAILMGNGVPKSPMVSCYVDNLPKEVFGIFNNYTPPGTSDPNPVGINSTYSNYTYLDNYFEIDIPNNRINITKSFKGKVWAWASDNVPSRIVLRNSEDLIIWDSGELSDKMYTDPVYSDVMTILKGWYFEFKESSLVEVYKTFAVERVL